MKSVWEQENSSKYDLSVIQFKILKSLVQGLKEKEIAEDMHLSISSIKYHKKQVYKLLEVDNINKVIVKAIKCGIVDLDNINI